MLAFIYRAKAVYFNVEVELKLELNLGRGGIVKCEDGNNQIENSAGEFTFHFVNKMCTINFNFFCFFELKPGKSKAMKVPLDFKDLVISKLFSKSLIQAMMRT